MIIIFFFYIILALIRFKGKRAPHFNAVWKMLDYITSRHSCLERNHPDNRGYIVSASCLQ